MMNRLRDLTSAGSGGSFVASAPAEPVVPAGFANPSVAAPTAIRPTPRVTSRILFIKPPPLLRLTGRRASEPAEAPGAGTAGSAPPAGGRGRPPARPAPRSFPRP